MSNTGKISISIVSHDQMELINRLLNDIDEYCVELNLEVILTLNTDRDDPPDSANFSFALLIIRNSLPKGFGANHNQAFAKSSGEFFCVANPDVRLQANPFCALMDVLNSPGIGVAAPIVVGKDGQLEDSARPFPTVRRVVRRAWSGRHDSLTTDLKQPFYADWVGGMFMLIKRSEYKAQGGFDERYFLYYEDVDFCGRMKLRNLHTIVCPQSRIVHEAQRDSHKKPKYLMWHLMSFLRFFTSSTFRQLWARGYL